MAPRYGEVIEGSFTSLTFSSFKNKINRINFLDKNKKINISI